MREIIYTNALYEALRKFDDGKIAPTINRLGKLSVNSSKIIMEYKRIVEESKK